MFTDIKCDVAEHPSSGVTFTENGRTIGFTLDATTDVVDCTYFNEKQNGCGGSQDTQTESTSGHPQSGVSFTVNGVTKQTTRTARRASMASRSAAMTS